MASQENQSHDENKIVTIQLDDAIILETDAKGNETLRLGFDEAGKTVAVRFPAYGKYDAYMKGLGDLLMDMSRYAENMLIPDDLRTFITNREGYFQWCAITAVALRPSKIRNKLEKLFFNYLEPQVDGKPINVEWARANLRMDTLIKLFIGVLLVEQWVKKNTTFLLEKIFRVQTKPPSTALSLKSSDTPSEKSTQNPASSSGFF